MIDISSKEYFAKSESKCKLYFNLDDPPQAHAAILIVHGLHDHSGRYTHVSNFFASHGLRTLIFDLSGNGKSEGSRGYLRHRSDHVLDVKCAVEQLQKWADGLPIFAFAHSMGALFLSHYILEYGNPFRGVVYSGGLFKVNEEISPFLQRISGVIAQMFPRLSTIKLDINGLSRDPEVAARVAEDKLQYFGGVRARTGDEILIATAELQQKLGNLNFPMLIMHGEEDTLTKCEASELLFEMSPAQDKTLKIYPGAKHELFNEINKEEVLTDVVEWVNARVDEDGDN